MMARNIIAVILGLWICCGGGVSAVCAFELISDSHRSAASQLFIPSHGSFPKLEETYYALRSFEVLGVSKELDVSTVACGTVSDVLASSSSTLKDLFYALRVNAILKCKISDGVFQGVSSRFQSAVNDASSLMDYHYSVGGLLLIKEQSSLDVQLGDAVAVIRSIKGLSQSDGKWRFSSSNSEASTYAAGIAFETLAGVLSLASSDIDQTMIDTIKNDIKKLFETIEKYDDGTLYFDEKLIDGVEHQGPVSTTASVVRGLTAFASVTSVNIPGEKILGLAKFLLGIGIPGDARDLFNQIDSLACLENNRVSIPLVLSLPATVFSLTKKDTLKVRVSTVLGSNAPPLAVKLVKGVSTGSKAASVIGSQELKFDPDNAVYFLDGFPKGVDVGKYQFVFEIVVDDSEQAKSYATGGHIQVPVYITGAIKTDSAEIAVLDSDLGSVETQKLNLAGENVVSFSANHLQKLRLSFQLTTPLGNAFKPHQAFLKLTHESKVEHVYVVESSGKKFEIILDFLRLVEKLYYLSGQYEIQLTVGDSVMENSFIKGIGHIDLDLPERPEKAPRPPLQSVDPYSRYAPKAEITHIFRSPDKRPPRELSLAFLGLTLLPFIGFLIGLLRLGINFKNFPSAPVPTAFALLFHLGIAAVLLLYVLFWLKLDLFTTLKTVGILGVFLIFVGHKILSHLASTSAKLKSA